MRSLLGLRIVPGQTQKLNYRYRSFLPREMVTWKIIVIIKRGVVVTEITQSGGAYV